MMQPTRSLLTLMTLVFSLCFPAIGNSRPFAPATPPPPDPIVHIQAILIDEEPADAPSSEQLQIKRVNGTTESASVGMQLFKGDEVKTGGDVEVSLLYEDPDTDYHVQVGVQENSRARIGSLWCFFGRFFISGWGSFDTRTQEVRLGKRGTEFYVDVEEDGSIELKVLEGEVEVEKVSGEQPPGQLNHADLPLQKITVGPLRSVKVKKEGIEAPRQLDNAEVKRVLDKTDKLVLASLGTITPLNVIPTSYTVSSENAADPEKNKRAAQEAFVARRHAAILSPTAENIASLGDAYKDLGAGKRAVKEYDKAVQLKPALGSSVKFLAGQAEAYRLSGNLKKATEKSEAAVKRSEAVATNPFEKRLAYTARGNAEYDLAVQYVAAGRWDNAGVLFRRTKDLYESANAEAPDAHYEWITTSNLLNASLAIDGNAGAAAELSMLSGTYRGLVSFPGANIDGPATVVIAGNRFSLVHCDERLTGSIMLRQQTAGALFVYLILDASTPIRLLSLKAELQDDKWLTLSNTENEKSRFSFATSVRQFPLTCVRLPNDRRNTAGRKNNRPEPTAGRKNAPENPNP